MDIISYNEYEIPSKLSKMVSPVYKELHKSKFEKYQILTRYISKLSDQYNNYKEVNHSHTKSIQSFFLKLKTSYYSTLDFKFASKLHYVKIIFDTPKFEKITKDRAAKFVDMLSAIGGTMGLLTGFSIISGVEILYFAVKFVLILFKRCARIKTYRTMNSN